tara:strand:+ start:136 stop:681 length:546 start_codon:yes stop_codon:yes gene_type:complete
MAMFHKIYKFASIARLLSCTVGTVLLLSSCSSSETPPVDESKGPISILTGKPSADGIKLGDLTTKNKPSGDGLPVNALLWRAALDIASFVPLDDVDTFGGSIVTEWHKSKSNPNQRLKLTMFVIGRELRSDAITVHAYLQNRLGAEWVDAGRDEALGRKLEGLVLNRARELRATNVLETVN